LSKIVPLDTVGQLVHGLKNAYEAGEIKGLVVSFIMPNGEFYFSAEGLTYIEKLGLLQAGIDTVNQIANEDDEE
jgi:hypothetical protein